MKNNKIKALKNTIKFLNEFMNMNRLQQNEVIHKLENKVKKMKKEE